MEKIFGILSSDKEIDSKLLLLCLRGVAPQPLEKPQLDRLVFLLLHSSSSNKVAALIAFRAFLNVTPLEVLRPVLQQLLNAIHGAIQRTEPSSSLFSHALRCWRQIYRKLQSEAAGYQQAVDGIKRVFGLLVSRLPLLLEHAAAHPLEVLFAIACISELLDAMPATMRKSLSPKEGVRGPEFVRRTIEKFLAEETERGDGDPRISKMACRLLSSLHKLSRKRQGGALVEESSSTIDGA